MLVFWFMGIVAAQTSLLLLLPVSCFEDTTQPLPCPSKESLSGTIAHCRVSHPALGLPSLLWGCSGPGRCLLFPACCSLYKETSTSLDVHTCTDSWGHAALTPSQQKPTSFPFALLLWASSAIFFFTSWLGVHSLFCVGTCECSILIRD
jgi:hypothetical protein